MAVRRVSFTGVWPIVATPFRAADESLDLAAFAKSIRFFADAGCNGATITGVLGESNRLTDAEREALIHTAITAAAEAAGSDRPMPICVGTSHAGTAATVALSQMAQNLGAAAVMVTPTKEPAPATAASLHTLFARVAEGCGPDFPIVLQDHPASTQVHMSTEIIVDIAHALPSIKCIKLESIPTAPKIAALRQLWQVQGKEPASKEGVTILTGLGALYAGFDMEQGTAGFMTGFAFPEILMAMNTAAAQNETDINRAFEIYERFLPLLVFEQQPGVAVRKEIYRLRGLLDDGHVRHPGSALSPVAAAALQRQLSRSFGDTTDLTKPIPPSLILRA